MATVTDVEVANASFPNVRQDLNDILEAIATNFSADAEPSTMYANQWWYETDTNKLYIRNEDNDAWIHVLTLDQTTDAVSSVEGVSADSISEGNSSVEVVDTGTGYIQINVDGAETARFDANGRLGIGTTSPTDLLEVSASSNPSIALHDERNATPIQIFDKGGVFVVEYNSTELMRVRGAGSPVGDFRFNSGYGSVATAYGCRAWVNFNGTGTVAIRASGNVSSITDNGTGDYTVNFTTAMPDGNYSVATSGGQNGTGASTGSTVNVHGLNNTSGTTTSSVDLVVKEYVQASTLRAQDSNEICIAVFR